MAATKVPSEHQEQVNFVNWMEYNHPQHRIFAIPNGGKRAGREGASLKAEGVRRGVPDLFIPSLKLFIEMKLQKGSAISSYQKDWLMYLNKAGYYTAICKGANEAKKEIEEILKITQL